MKSEYKRTKERLKMNLELEFKKRHKKLKKALNKKENLKGLLLSNSPNLVYLTGKSTGKVLFTPEKEILWVKKLYKELDEKWYSKLGFEIREYEKGKIKKYINRHAGKLRFLGVDEMSATKFKKIKKDLKPSIEITDIAERTRMIKTSQEIEHLKKAASIARKGMEKASEVIKEGRKEMEAVAEIEYEIRKNNSESPPFHDGMLLASGKSSANIHAKAGQKKIKGLTLVDLGAKCQGYYSDMTRTFSAGEPSSKEKKALEFIENLELEIIDDLELGMKASKVYGKAEEKLQEQGYQFHHALGHGVGLELHERPAFYPEEEIELKENMVFTIEPGIYLPGKFGIRFEDMVLMTKNGAKNLTRF